MILSDINGNFGTIEERDVRRWSCLAVNLLMIMDSTSKTKDIPSTPNTSCRQGLPRLAGYPQLLAAPSGGHGANVGGSGGEGRGSGHVPT